MENKYSLEEAIETIKILSILDFEIPELHVSPISSFELKIFPYKSEDINSFLSDFKLNNNVDPETYSTDGYYSIRAFSHDIIRKLSYHTSVRKVT